MNYAILDVGELAKYFRPENDREKILHEALQTAALDSIELNELLTDTCYSTGEELLERFNEMEDELAKAKKKLALYVDYDSFFQSIVYRFEQKNGDWPSALPSDEGLKNRICESIICTDKFEELESFLKELRS